ncbi:uncharacterized protein G2W53_037396 [Senna tora]|uniref:Uncharacterized protein n=1 Tax=Senna tora TaxID=362788 RepID=A0A834SU99_9FABA|nr:uncharacterized protein G2W53_037396 [Senna tora]
MCNIIAPKSKLELPYVMIITIIAKYMNVDESLFEEERAAPEDNYDQRLLLDMGYIKEGNDWVRPKDVTPKLSRRKFTEHRRPPRKSTQLTKPNDPVRTIDITMLRIDELD